MKVWITRYALTQGLFQIDAEIVDGIYASGRTLTGDRIFTRDWAKTPEDALAKAHEMRRLRIASLKRSITKLAAKCFTVSPSK